MTMTLHHSQFALQDEAEEVGRVRLALASEVRRAINGVASRAGISVILHYDTGSEQLSGSPVTGESPEAEEPGVLKRIPAVYDGRKLGEITILDTPGASSLLPAIEYLIETAFQQFAVSRQEEALLEELSASWESLEAVYEISSDLRTIQTPNELLDRIVRRAAAIDENLSVVLWIGRDGRLEPLALFNATAPDKGLEDGLVGRSIAERKAVVLNGRAKIAASGNDVELERANGVAIAPIATRQGLLGALEVWKEGGESSFDSHTIRLIQALALQAAMVVENDRLHRASLESQRLRQEVEIGSKIQKTLLFGQPPHTAAGLEIAALTLPSQFIDGDFYDFFDHSAACLDLIVGDVMGKGIPAALLGAATKSHFLRSLSRLLASTPNGQLPPPEEIVMIAHSEVTGQMIELDSFATLCFARFDTASSRLTFVDCGHTPTIHYHSRSQTTRLLKGDNMPLGFSEGERYRQNSVSFKPGDVFLFYSDGLTEARNPQDEMFGEERLATFVRINSNLPPGELVANIRAAVVEFCGTEKFADDSTCIAVRIRPDHFESKLVITSELDNLAAVREFVRSACRDLTGGRVDPESASGLELAVNEAVTNVIRHAYSGRSDREIEIIAVGSSDRLAFSLCHTGEDFDPSAVPEPSFDGSREGGFGLFIIEQCTDEVGYTRDEQGRNCIRLVKHLKTREPQEMEFNIELSGDVAILTVPGDHLDAGNAKDFKRDVAPMIAAYKQLAFDMSNLQFVDSSGLGALLGCLRQMNSIGGELKLFGLTKPVRALIELVRMHRIFDIYNTREEALVAFGK
ncbi:MAG: anti-sigma factor antagonist [Acidobacteria bacterium]|nr:anti-sigma factor antagonist [Acidobacteriota bacterium]